MYHRSMRDQINQHFTGFGRALFSHVCVSVYARALVRSDIYLCIEKSNKILKIVRITSAVHIHTTCICQFRSTIESSWSDVQEVSEPPSRESGC